jgi:hypothetical protein
MRDNTVLGPAALAPGITVSGQTHPAADSRRPLFAGYHLLFALELPTISQRGQ